ncbi:hypothetical protein [Chondromyces crocatus]|uniref:Secreted protein n=1 Tax=Chondromyces crocatus TaxID=52 RepID=A0A0K1EMG2_CHOCO|nr:hypothetical protein [Chondromyces crocatus]AKT42011.1 uncharacterized protein CMC5_062330 [Chondromyces crocatus]
MLARALGLLGFAGLLACGSAVAPEVGASGRSPVAPGTRGAPVLPGQPLAGGGRWFQNGTDMMTWVRSGDAQDEAIFAGSRMVLSPGGELLEAAWEGELWATGKPIIGAIAVAPQLGGGFVHWTREEVFRSSTFTGPLQRVHLGMTRGEVRGARNDLAGVVVFTDRGPRLLPAGASETQPYPEAGVFDAVALDASRAARMDMFGRARVTRDGGRSWSDVSSETGMFVRGLVPGKDAVSLETWMGGIVFGPEGTLGRLDTAYRPRFLGSGKYFQSEPGQRERDFELLPWMWRQSTPVGAAVLGGVRLGDALALAVVSKGGARVSLRTGEASLLSSGWLSDELNCVPQAAGDAVLFLCSWDEQQTFYGSVVLRSEGGQPPVVEKLLSDDGFFAADDRGAVGFVGSCSEKARWVDPNDTSRMEWGEVVPAPVLCVRRRPGDWVERAVELEERQTMVAWVPQRDGGAVAFVTGEAGHPLPPPVGMRRVTAQGGVRVVRVDRVAPEWRIGPPTYGSQAPRGAVSLLVDRRFRVLDDGRVVGWLSAAGSGDTGSSGVSRGVTFGTDGSVVVHPLPANVAGMVVTGDHGLLIDSSGALHETVDHGRSFHAAGRSPVPPSAFTGACSSLGCTFDGVVRLGWSSVVSVGASGAAAVGASGAASAVRAAASGETVASGKVASADGRFSVSPDPGAACRSTVDIDLDQKVEPCRRTGPLLAGQEGAAPRPRLSCTPVGAPAPRPPAALTTEELRNERMNMRAAWGDELVLLRDAKAPPPDENEGAATSEEERRAGAAVRPKSGPVLRTHSLVYRVPFDLGGSVLRLNATEIGQTLGSKSYRRFTAVPLLEASGALSVLLLGEEGEAIVRPGGLTRLPGTEGRRFAEERLTMTPGLALGPDSAVLLVERYHRSALEVHGVGAQRPLFGMGPGRDGFEERLMALARHEDGAQGILVLDGDAPETVGVSRIDALKGPGPVERLAPWSTLTPGSEPACKAKGGWHALVALRPEHALAMEDGALPNVQLARYGIARVRWGRERVCVDALDVQVEETRGGSAGAAQMVMRWGSGAGGALLTSGIIQGLSCTVHPPAQGAGPGDAQARRRPVEVAP